MERTDCSSSNSASEKWTFENIHLHKNFQSTALRVFFPEYAAAKKKRECAKKSFSCAICAQEGIDENVTREIVVGNGPGNL
jgi:hypothetical protein